MQVDVVGGGSVTYVDDTLFPTGKVRATYSCASCADTVPKSELYTSRVRKDWCIKLFRKCLDVCENLVPVLDARAICESNHE